MDWNNWMWPILMMLWFGGMALFKCLDERRKTFKEVEMAKAGLSQDERGNWVKK